EKQKEINARYEKYESDRKLFKLDENENVVFYDNTTIPRPRDRKIEEEPEDYDTFLREKYGPVIEEYYKKNRELQEKASQDKTILLPPHKQQPELPPHKPQLALPP